MNLPPLFTEPCHGIAWLSKIALTATDKSLSLWGFDL